MAKTPRPADKTEVDPTAAVRDAGTGVHDTKSGYLLPDGTLVNYVDGGEEAAAPVATEETDAVEEAARARIDDDAPGGDVDDATAGEGGGAGLAVDRVFDGADFDLAELIGQTSGDEDADGLFGRIGRDDVTKDKPGADLLGGGDESGLEAPFSRRPAAFEAGPGAREAGVFDLVDQPGAADTDPLSSFVGAVEARLGRDLGLTTPSDTTDPSAPIGKDSIAAGGNGITVRRGREEPAYYETSRVYDTKQFIEVTDTNNGTITRVYDDGATKTTTLDGTVTGTTPPLEPTNSSTPLPAVKTTQELEAEKKQQDDEAKKKEDDKKEEDKKEEPKKEEDKKDDAGGGAKQPDPENETAPLPDELTRPLDADVLRLRQLRNQGPDSGDGITDPSEIESEVVGTAAALPTHAELGQQLFGQPPADGITTGGGDTNLNPGADSQGAGVITPGDDQAVVGGPRRNDDPFDAAPSTPEPVAEPNDPEGDVSFLPPTSEIAGPVDAVGDDVPDSIDADPPG